MRTVWLIGVFFSFSILTALGQDGPKPISTLESYTSQLVTVIDNFTIAWERFSNRRQAKRTIRSIGFFQSDLSSYLKQRKYIIELLQENDFDRSKSLITSELKRLQKRFKRLSRRLYSIRAYLNDSDVTNTAESFIREAFHIFDQQGPSRTSIRAGIRRKRNFLGDLERFLSGQAIDKEALIADGERIETGLEQAIENMGAIKDEIRERYNL